MAEKKPPLCEGAMTAGRFAAGGDPAKREQILEGAKRVFMTVGFDAASINDITREAGVSKGTIYVYFANKDDLFAALMERERARVGQSMQDMLSSIDSAEEGLRRLGMGFAERITSDATISAMRTMIGVVPRMPKLSRRFFQGDTLNVHIVLEQFLHRQIEKGALVIDDVELAARQFMELSTGTFMKMRLFGDMPAPPTQSELQRIVDGALNVFLAAYGAKKNHSATE
jgi:AcrR family transcriptional regulator